MTFFRQIINFIKNNIKEWTMATADDIVNQLEDETVILIER